MNDPETQAAQGGAAAVGAIRSDLYSIGTDVEVKYPRTKVEEQGDRAAWPWLPGWIVEVCGPDEWQVCVQDYALALPRTARSRRPASPSKTCCSRAASGTAQRSGYGRAHREPWQA